MIPTAVLLVAVAALAGLLAVLVATIGVRRVVRGRADRRRARVVATLRPQVAAVVAEALDAVLPEAVLPAAVPAGAVPPEEVVALPVEVVAVGVAVPGVAAVGVAAPRHRAAGRRRGRHAAAPATPGAGELLRLSDRLPRWQRSILDDVVLGYLGKIRGPARQPLLDLLEHNGTVPRARRRLDHPGLVGRARAAEILGRAGGPEVVLDLVALLFDRQPEVRAVAAAGLAGAPPSARVVQALLASVEGDHPVPAGLIVDTLVRLGPAGTPYLAEALARDAPHVRAVAAEALGLLGTTDATEALLTALHDPAATVEVQIRAAGALGRIGAPVAVDPLIGCLAPEQPPELRSAAARALGELSSPRAVPHLVPLLTGTYPLASTAAAALTRLGSAGARALADVAHREPETPAGQHAAAGLAGLDLGALETSTGAPVMVPTPAG